MKPKKLIKSSIHIHDKNQIEIVFYYKFRKFKFLKNRLQNYQVDVYFVIPPQMGINENTYPKTKFFQDLRPLIRFKEPHVFYEKKDPNEKFLSPVLKKVYELLDIYKQNPTPDTLKQLGNAIRIFAGTVHYHIQKQTITMLIFVKQNPEKRLQRLDKFIKEMYSLFSQWHAFGKLIDQNNLELKKEFDYADEYCIISMLENLAKLGNEFDLADKKNPQPKEFKKILAIIRMLHHYAQKRSFRIVSLANSRREQENYLLHTRWLKRYIFQVFFLFVKETPSFTIYKQLSYMTAAGLAGLWALAANIFIWHQLNFSGYKDSFDLSRGLLSFSGYTLILMFTFVMAYVLKDRIKELGRTHFQKYFKNIPDTTDRIYYESAPKKRFVVGYIKEFVNFLGSYKKIPQDLMNKRKENFSFNLAEDNVIIHYKKIISLKDGALDKMHIAMPGVKDIIRLNIKRFINRLDDPIQKTLMVSKTGQISSCDVAKTYPLDILLCYKMGEGKDSKMTLETKRLMLTQSGIEEVLEKD